MKPDNQVIISIFSISDSEISISHMNFLAKIWTHHDTCLDDAPFFFGAVGAGAGG